MELLLEKIIDDKITFEKIIDESIIDVKILDQGSIDNNIEEASEEKMYSILTLNTISDSGLNELPDLQYEVSPKVECPDAILLRSYKLNESDIDPNVKAIARAGAGTNNIPIDYCSEKGIVVFNTPGANANAVKELVVTGLMLSSRKIVDGINWVSSLKGTDDISAVVEKYKSRFTGPELKGKTIGVIGLGAIGVVVANVAQSLGMNVLGYDPFISVDAAWNLSRSVSKANDFKILLSECDYVTVHTPLNKETNEMLNEEAFEAMKQGARVLNFSRGELVNFDALKKSLENGKVSVYVTDFPTSELLELDNVIAIPHLGASTPESEDNCAQMAALQLKDFLETGSITNSVNFPDCQLPMKTRTRIAIAHKNIPNMVSSIANAFAKLHINIDNMTNRSKGNWAYSVIEVDSIDEECKSVEEIRDINGVVSVRVI